MPFKVLYRSFRGVLKAFQRPLKPLDALAIDALVGLILEGPLGPFHWRPLGALYLEPLGAPWRLHNWRPLKAL